MGEGTKSSGECSSFQEGTKSFEESTKSFREGTKSFEEGTKLFEEGTKSLERGATIDDNDNGRIGLVNIGIDCDFNSLIQSLF